MRLRYIIYLPQEKFKQKIYDVENVVKGMLNTAELKQEEIKSILGYNRKLS